jgi:LysM repeat protein
VYVVKKGDTLYGISRRFRVSTDNLLRWNHIGVLTTGQKLIIYRGSAKTRKPAAQVKISEVRPKPDVVASIPSGAP